MRIILATIIALLTSFSLVNGQTHIVKESTNLYANADLTNRIEHLSIGDSVNVIEKLDTGYFWIVKHNDTVGYVLKSTIVSKAIYNYNYGHNSFQKQIQREREQFEEYLRKANQSSSNIQDTSSLLANDVSPNELKDSQSINDSSSIIEARKAIEQWYKKYPSRSEDISSGDGKGSPSGTIGNFNYDISGFGIAAIPNIINKSQDDGSVTIEVCLDKNGQIKSLRKTGGTSSSEYLKTLSMDAIRKFKFFPIGNQAETNCGTITFNYAPH